MKEFLINNLCFHYSFPISYEYPPLILYLFDSSFLSILFYFILFYFQNGKILDKIVMHRVSATSILTMPFLLFLSYYSHDCCLFLFLLRLPQLLERYEKKLHSVNGEVTSGQRQCAASETRIGKYESDSVFVTALVSVFVSALVSVTVCVFPILWKTRVFVFFWFYLQSSCSGSVCCGMDLIFILSLW